MSLDLNTINGFASLTGDVSSLLTSISGAIGGTWNIQEASYGHNGKQILFHVFKSSANYNAAVDHVQDSGGHRKIPIVFPYQDGQSTDDLGREGESFDFNILIHGPNYKAQYQKLLAEFNDPTPGTLIHPIKGKITVVAQSWIQTHMSSTKQAVALKVRFLEHSFSVDYSVADVAKNVPSALTSAISFISTISSAITFAQSIAFVASNTRNLVAAILQGYLKSYTANLNRLNQTFNGSGAVTGIGGSLIPGLAPTVSGQDSGVFPVAASPNSAFNGTGTTVDAQGSQQLNSALASQQAIDSIAALRVLLNSYILQIEATEDNQGSLIFYDTILSLKESAVSIQSVLELGLQTSNNTVVTYKTPREMSAREVCFANGLSPDNSYDIEVLNPSLLSLNLIPRGTIVQVPT